MQRKHIIISLLTGLFLTACGGGGGGGDETVTTTEYTGLRTPAIITQENAEELAEEAISAGTEDLAATSYVLGVELDSDDAVTPKLRSVSLPLVLSEQVQKLPLDGLAFLPGVTQTQTETEACEGGGSVTTTITADDATGDFSGSMVFDNCVSDDVTLSGNATFSGIIDVDTLNSIQFTMTFTELTEQYAAESYTLNGSVSLTMSNLLATSGAEAITVMNFTVRDNLTGTVEMLQDYRVVVTDLVSEVRLTIAGRFYDPEHGYIDVTTIDPLLISYTEDYPYTGQFVVEGDNSALRVTCISSAQYTLEVDANGDGFYETVTTETW